MYEKMPADTDKWYNERKMTTGKEADAMETTELRKSFSSRFTELMGTTSSRELQAQYYDLTHKILSTETISYYKGNMRLPNTETLVNLSQMFNCSVDYLLGLPRTMEE